MPTSLDDLSRLTELEGPFATLLLPAPSHHADAGERFDIRRKNALKAIGGRWPEDDLEALEQELDALPHDAGAGVIVVRAANGTTFVEFVDDPLEPAAFVGPFPRLAPLIESRQRTVSHVVVEADKAGADLTAFDGGSVIATDAVDGDTEHIHRGHPGGWSQRRFQQRAENTWEENADDVAEATRQLADGVGARLVAVAGPPRARSMVVEAHEADPSRSWSVVNVESGDADGIAADVTRATADVAATDAKRAIDAATESMATADDFDGDVLAALRAGRVETLLVHDDGSSGDDRHVDRCISAALASGAAVQVVPNVAVLRHGVAAVLRW